jgi:hypothetical protein
MVLLFVYVVCVRIRRITLPQKYFTCTCFSTVSMPNYNCWTKHGERGVTMEDNEEEEDDDNYPEFPEYGDTFMGEAEGGAEGGSEGEAHDEPPDDLGRTIADAQRECETNKEREKLDHMLEDHKKSLYPNCQNGMKKLGSTLELLKWKAEEGLSDSGFEKLLKMMRNTLPKDNELPTSTYEAKKIVCPLGLEVQKIHACPNDCILDVYARVCSCRQCWASKCRGL